MNTRTLIPSATLAVLALATLASAQTPQKPSQPEMRRDAPSTGTAQKSDADQQFVHKAAEDGLAEVAAGTMAAAKASNTAVKEFAEHMVADHSKANEELTRLAQGKGWQVPAEPGQKHKKGAASLEKLEGGAFDRAYMKQMVADHQTAVALFKKQSTGGHDAELKSWVNETLPTLEKHLEMARGIAKKLASTSY